MQIPNDEVCGKCPFFATRHERCVPPPPPTKKSVALIGMNPGRQEWEKKKYFVGPAGDNLNVGLQMIDLPRESVHIDNAVKCRFLDSKTESIKATHLKYCREYLDYAMQIVDPDLIIVAGNEALQSVTGMKGIMSKIKKLLWSERYGKPVLAILHPASILHNPNNKRIYLESVSYVGRFIHDELTSQDDLGEYHVIETRAELDDLIFKIKEHGIFFFDIENNQRMPYDPLCRLKCVSLTYKPRLSFCFPYAVLAGDLQQYFMRAMKYLITAEDIDVGGHNEWFDLRHFTIPLGIRPKGKLWDTQYEHYLLDQNVSHKLKDLAWEFSKLGGYEKDVDSRGGPGIIDPCPELYLYNNIDTDLSFRLHELFYPRLKSEGLLPPYERIIMPAAEVLAEMEDRGVLLDREYADDLRTKAEQMMPDILSKIRALPQVQKFEKKSSGVFNPNSGDHIGEVLFGLCGYPIIEETKKTNKPKTTAKVLEKIEKDYDKTGICKLILDYKLVYGLWSKYLGKLEALTDDNNRIHTSYLLHVTRSGRSSSAGPNLQNIPVRGKDVLDVKNCFIPSPGNYLLEADFSQHEYRVVAGVAPDPLMLELFRKDRENYEKVLRGEKSWEWYKEPGVGVALDMHRANAAEMYGVPYDQVTTAQRKAAKGLSFGVLYGMGADKLAGIFKSSKREAEMYLAAYFRKFSGVKSWKDRETDLLYKNRYVQTCTGRRRYFPYVDGDAVREGLNTEIQGPASDFMLIAIKKIWDWFKKLELRTKLNTQVHDSISADTPPDELHIVVPIMRECMETAAEGYVNVPLQADFAIGYRWGELEELWKFEGLGQIDMLALP